MSVLKESSSVVSEAESLVLGRRLKFRAGPANTVVDAVLHVPWFIIAGMQALFFSLVTAALLIPVWWVALFFVILFTGEDVANFTSWAGWGASSLLAAGSVVFGLPSRSNVQGVREENIDKLARYIESIAASPERVEFVRKGVGEIEAAGARRISVLSWGLGLYWAILFWVISNWILAPSVSESIRQGSVSSVFAGFLVFIFFGSGVVCYREAYRLMSQTISFAFIEVESRQIRKRP